MRYPPIDELVARAGSKYLLTVIAARRARQILEEFRVRGTEDDPPPRPVSQALEEFYQGKLRVILPDGSGDPSGRSA
ncbi:DNA-directed RNA polymerase subunit omega [Brockia lithotrophica]|uniref:DNA-directed RNA polymerase subunit omega n=1 Tax=Brockia lithotrophica TaxID=933949 RepID=A0A660L7I9_9BACL|nr:DNA-directed RNA polymerase subunit omega [Brockia lithotrophica]RKQ88802.1 DNA-directed RNA polymerase subunit omega [Brockia lithotrophica]